MLSFFLYVTNCCALSIVVSTYLLNVYCYLICLMYAYLPNRLMFHLIYYSMALCRPMSDLLKLDQSSIFQNPGNRGVDPITVPIGSFQRDRNCVLGVLPHWRKKISFIEIREKSAHRCFLRNRELESEFSLAKEIQSIVGLSLQLTNKSNTAICKEQFSLSLSSAACRSLRHCIVDMTAVCPFLDFL